MTAVLVVIRDELSRARQLVSALEQSEESLAAIYEPAAPMADVEPPTRPPATPRRQKTRRHGRNPDERRIRKHIADHGPATRGDLLEALGGHPEATSRRLSILLARGEIEAEGTPRRYRVPHVGDKSGESSVRQLVPATPRGLIGARPQQPEPGRYPVYDALVGTAGATTAELAKRTRMTPIAVQEQGRELARLGLVAFRGRGAARFWMTPSDGEADATLTEASS
jgi:predicted transcriptional regulator